MTIQEFKNEAVHRGTIYDNSEKAAQNWSSSWGLTWWRSVWFYREYRLGNLIYRTGKVRQRHRSFQNTEFLIDNREVRKCDFMKVLDSFVLPDVTDDEKKYIERQELLEKQAAVRRAVWHRSRVSRTQNASVNQLSIPFNEITVA